MIGADDLVPGPPGPGTRRGRGPDDLVPRPAAVVAHPLLDLVRSTLRAVTLLSPLPVGRNRLLWFATRPAGGGVADVYVCAWIAVLIAGAVVADGDHGAVAAGVAVFRYGDLVTTLALVVLDPVGPRVADPRRQLVFLALHALELVLIVATVFRWIVGERFGSALMTALDVLTMQSPVRHPGNWIEVTRAMAVGGVVLIVALGVVAAVRIGRER